MRTIRRWSVPQFALLVILTTGCAGDSSTAAQDRELATAVVLTAEDLPGYVEAEPGSPGGGLKADTCNGPNKTWDERPRKRGASGGDFRRDGDSVRVQSAALVTEEETEAQEAMAYLRRTLSSDCVRENDRALLAGDDMTIQSFSVEPLPDLRLGDETVGFRTTARVSSEGKPSTLYFDLLYIRSGRVIGGMMIFQFQTPFPADERARLATVMAGRMQGVAAK